MSPTFKAGRVVVAVGIFSKLKPRDIVILSNQGREIIKRIKLIKNDKVFVVGDNLNASTDSREFGWLNRHQIKARVIWPVS